MADEGPKEERRKTPAYPWYYRDYAEDEAVKLMTYEQEGVYRRLLDHQANEGGLPTDVEKIATLVPKVTTRRFKAVIWPSMAHKFQPINGRLVNPKLERVKQELVDYKRRRSEAGKAGADARWAS